MKRPAINKVMVPTVLLGLVSPFLLSTSAGAQSIRTSGSGNYIDVSWTESDPDDLLGLPGNVHVGYLYAQSGSFGTFIGGNVTDFDCDEGESPFGGHGLAAAIVDEGSDTAADASQDAIDDVIDSGAAVIDATVVADAVQTQLSEEIPDVVQDEFEEFPTCDYIQDRFLNGDDTATLTVDAGAQVARVTGKLTVSNGGHGEPGTVLGRPPIKLTISGGDWEKYEYSYASRSATYRYSNSEKGTRYNNGTVTGGIGAMGFADDSDDVSYASFTSYRYRTVERVR